MISISSLRLNPFAAQSAASKVTVPITQKEVIEIPDDDEETDIAITQHLEDLESQANQKHERGEWGPGTIKSAMDTRIAESRWSFRPIPIERWPQDIVDFLQKQDLKDLVARRTSSQRVMKWPTLNEAARSKMTELGKKAVRAHEAQYGANPAVAALQQQRIDMARSDGASQTKLDKMNRRVLAGKRAARRNNDRATAVGLRANELKDTESIMAENLGATVILHHKMEPVEELRPRQLVRWKSARDEIVEGQSPSSAGDQGNNAL
ncbi:hypothetical protein KCU65_g1442, partial [Aureobasidium melanogenum]